MSLKRKLTVLFYFLFLMLTDVKAASSLDRIDTSGTIVRLIAFLLGICGSLYLAAVLWQRSEKGSEGWKFLSVSMLMFTFWNIIMSMNIMLIVLYSTRYTYYNSDILEAISIIFGIVKILDPVIEVVVFIVLALGLKMIIKAIRDRPWTVFSREEHNE